VRPRLVPTWIVDDSTRTDLTRDRKKERAAEGSFDEQRKRVLFVTLCWFVWCTEGYSYWCTRIRSWHSSRNRDRRPKNLSQD
jgi:putative SOS response-associated peptidase YedK